MSNSGSNSRRLRKDGATSLGADEELQKYKEEAANKRAMIEQMWLRINQEQNK